MCVCVAKCSAVVKGCHHVSQRLRDKVIFKNQFVPALPTMQLGVRRFKQRFRCVLLVAS